MATYIRLTDYKDSDSKEQGFFKSENRYEAKQDDFEKIPGSPIIYWFQNKIIDKFQGKLLSEIPIYTGMATSDNDKFLRFWQECEMKNINFSANAIEDTFCREKWFPYNKGGSIRKWYGNFEYIVNFQNDGIEIKDEVNRKYPYLKGNTGFYIRYQEHYFKQGITWSAVSSGRFSVRLHSKNSIFSNAGFVAIPDNDFLFYMSLMNSSFSYYVISALAQTINNNASDIEKLPVIFPKQESTKQTIDTLTQECIDISKEDWDSRETSWDFTASPLLIENGKLRIENGKIEDAYNAYCEYWKEKFYQLHANEEELNRLFIDIYELGDELTSDVDLKDITILKSESIINDNNELEFKADEIMKQFISYAVGVMFGRYSLDKDGLQIANLGSEILISQMTDETKVSFPIDDDNVIPVLEDDYFSDDIASRVINFVKTTFGSESLSENINFIEKCLGKTIRAYMVKDFYEDHIKRYKKRPIYWMVSSPKKGFMSLSYMHRYTNDLFARVQNNYLREYITKLEGTKDILRQIIVDESASSKDKKDADKKIKDIENKLKELISFDRDVLTSYAQNRVDIDLDDGVKVNYNKFKEVLYPIKGLDKE